MSSDTSAICWRRNWHSPWRAASYCLGSTTATLCCTVLQPAAFRSCSAYRIPRHELFCRHRDSHHLNHSWNSYTGCQFANASTTSLPSWLTRSDIHQVLHTSVTTSDLGNLHATSVLQPHRCYTDRLPELTSPAALSDALLLPSGTLWTLILCAVAL